MTLLLLMFWLAAPVFKQVELFHAGTGGDAVYRIPGIVVTKQGTILAFAEARKDAKGDWGEEAVLVRRSSDRGETWSEARALIEAGHKTVHNATAIPDRKTGALHFLYCVNYANCFYMRSDDDGRTFGKPADITGVFEQFRPEYHWNVIATGPGHGIQLRNGRLVVPVWLSTGGKKHRPSVVASIYSDDRGKTWKRGEILPGDLKNPSETVAVQLRDGRVMFNIRNEGLEHRRAISFSPDGARRWSKPVFDEQLIEPVCMGSIIRVDKRILFVNPNDPKTRRNLTVRLSSDEGRTWPVSRVVEPEIAGYSDVAVAPDKTIYVFYERGGLGGNAYSTAALWVARFNVEWVIADIRVE